MSISRQVLILNGPNLSALGVREPEIYGDVDAAGLQARITAYGASLGLQVSLRFTDDEAELVGWLHEAARERLPVVLNPAAFTHYSYALRDAVAHARGLGSQVIEVHLSNPAARETFRHTSVIAGVANGTIAGFGIASYELALTALAAAE